MSKKTGKTVSSKHSELVASRFAAMEKRVQKLEDELFDTKKAAQKTEARLNEEILGLELEIKKRDQRIEDLTKSNTYLRNKLFGSQTEKDDVRSSGDSETNEKQPSRKRGQQPGSKGHGRSVKEVARQTEVEISVPQTCCTKCSKAFLVLDEVEDSKLIKFHQYLEETTYNLLRNFQQEFKKGNQPEQTRKEPVENPVKFEPTLAWTHSLRLRSANINGQQFG